MLKINNPYYIVKSTIIGLELSNYVIYLVCAIIIAIAFFRDGGLWIPHDLGFDTYTYEYYIL